MAVATLVFAVVDIAGEWGRTVRRGDAAGSAAFWALGAAAVWAMSTLLVVLVLFRRRDPAPSIVGFAQVLGLAGAIGLGASSTIVRAAQITLTLISLAMAFRLWATLLLTAAAGIVSPTMLMVQHESAVGVYVAVLAVAAFALILWIRLEAREWERQSSMFNQARWAASEFITVNVRMQDTIDRTAGLTRMRERVRVAREIHDTVGYTLTAVLMQVQAAREVFRAQPSQLPARLSRLETMVRESIQEVRREVSNLRDESVIARSGNSRWQRLCKAFADGTGIRVYAEFVDDLEQVSPRISECVYRILQEALTNAYRHGAADYVDVRMAYDKPPGLVLLRVSDNGRGAEMVKPGNGLSGMRERVSELYGQIEWRTGPGQGFDLGIELPWDGNVDESDSSAAG